MDIGEFPAFTHLNETQLENLRCACEELTIGANEGLIKRGERGGSMYFLLDGELQVYVVAGDREVELVRLHAPAVVGELELLTGTERTASVRALSEARLLCLAHQRFLDRIDEGDPAMLKVLYAIARLTAGRLASMTDKFVEIESTAEPARSDELRAFRTKLFGEWSFERSV